MNDREIKIISLRPLISSAQVNENTTSEESFQNTTLRPILKLQNPIFIALFSHYIKKHKNKFYSLSLEKRFEYIENAIQKDIKFRNSLKGVIIGLFSLEEYELYLLNSSSFNKRMMKMLVERLKDQIQIFENQALV
tara:strand:- start:55840 stop:56247 length:408 start_codon:yes stop_codon:yes gene_type:complete